MAHFNIVLDDGKHDGQFALALEIVGFLLFLVSSPFLPRSSRFDGIWVLIIFGGFMAYGAVLACETFYHTWRERRWLSARGACALIAAVLLVFNWHAIAWFFNRYFERELWMLWR